MATLAVSLNVFVGITEGLFVIEPPLLSAGLAQLIWRLIPHDCPQRRIQMKDRVLIFGEAGYGWLRHGCSS